MATTHQKKGRGDDSNAAAAVNYSVASSWSWSKSMSNPETATTKIKGPSRLLPPFKGEHLQH